MYNALVSTIRIHPINNSSRCCVRFLLLLLLLLVCLFFFSGPSPACESCAGAQTKISSTLRNAASFRGYVFVCLCMRAGRIPFSDSIDRVFFIPLYTTTYIFGQPGPDFAPLSNAKSKKKLPKTPRFEPTTCSLKAQLSTATLSKTIRFLAL